MSIEVLPNWNQCNLDCKYCYEKPARDAETRKYDSEKFKARLRMLNDTVDRNGNRISNEWLLFGGEPLANMPLAELEEILQIGYNQRGYTGLQTNGSLITERHIDLFEKYNTGVGISIDGPGELNDARWVVNLEQTRKATARTEWAIDALVARANKTGNYRLIPNLIVSLHKTNASAERLPILKDWFRKLASMGIKWSRLHYMDLDYKASEIALSTEEVIQASMELWDLHDESTIKFDIFNDILTLLRVGASGTSEIGPSGYAENPCCVWNGCDPWNTSAVEAVMGDGTSAQCGRGSGNDGKNWQPAYGMGTPSVNRASGVQGQRFHERQLSLYVTPQENGGCKDCRFWLFCLGQCPGSGPALATDTQGDWRHKTIYCDVLKHLFAEAEKRIQKSGVIPLSLVPARKEIEIRVYEEWARGGEPKMPVLAKMLRGTLQGVKHEWFSMNGHGDHNDAPPPMPKK